MDFSQVDMDKFLQSSFPLRFQNVSPFDFEDFVAELFRKDNFKVEQTEYTGDFGADMIVEKDSVRTAIQIKRYSESSKVGVKDINQVIAAREYYETDEALVIATTDFTNAAQKMSDSADVDLWDWDDLAEAICNVLMDQKDYYSYFREELHEENTSDVDFSIYPGSYEDTESESISQFHFEIENTSGKNLPIVLELPIIITKSNRQVKALDWENGYFSNGVIYNGVRVQCACSFMAAQLEDILPGDRLILRIFYPDQNSYVTLEEKIKGSKSGCLGSSVLLSMMLLTCLFSILITIF